MNDPITFMVMLIPSISASPFCGCVWTANPLGTAMVQVCIVMLSYNHKCIVIFFVTSVISLLCLLNIATSGLWSVTMITLWVKQ